MPVFSVVNALARSLGLESDQAALKKSVDSMPATRTSSTDSNTTAVDEVEVKLKEVNKVDDTPELCAMMEEVVVIEADGKKAVEEQALSQTNASSVSVDQSEAAAPNLQIRGGMVEPLGVEAPATYADATNLANLYPALKDEILALPLSPKKIASPAVHTPDRPNWATAPDEPKTPPARAGRRTPGHRGRGKGHDSPSGRTTPRKSSPVVHTRNNPGKSQRQPHSREPSRSPKKAPSTPHERSESNEAIIAPSPTYICLPSGASVVVGDSRFPSGGSVPNPADVDALIRELQNARGMGETNSTSAASSPEKACVATTAVPPPPIRPVAESTSPRGGHDGMLHSNVDSNELSTPSKAPETAARVVTVPTSQAHSRTASPRPCTPSPLRHTMLHRVNDILERCRERSQSPTLNQKQQERGQDLPSRVASPLREAATLPASPEPEVLPATVNGRITPVITTKPVRMPSPPVMPPDSPKASVMRRPVTAAGPDILKPKERWPTLDEVLATQAKAATTSNLE